MQRGADEPDWTTVPPRPDHLDAIMEIEKVCFPSPWKRPFYLQELEQEHRYHRIIQVNGRLAGYLFSYFIVPEIHISKVAVDPRYQGRGWGSRLMKAMESFCLEKGIDRAILEVRATNVQAMSFYRNWSYRVVGRRRRYYSDGEDALVMMAPVPRPDAEAL